VVIGGLVFASLTFQGLRTNPASAESRIFWVSGLSGLVYLVLITFFAVPLIKKQPQFGWALAITNGIAFGIIEHFEAVLIPGISIPLAITLIVILAVLSGRWPTYFFTLLALTAVIVTNISGAGGTIVIFLIEAVLIPIIAIVITETILGLRNSLMVEMKRLQTLNRVARSLASSLEMHQVVALVSSAIQNAFAADTYYVGLIQGESLHMELFYDDGEFFPAMDITLKDSLAGIVVDTRSSLLVRDLVAERKRRNLPFIIVGRPRVSSSWMGTVLNINGRIVGMIGVASYQKNSFDDGDLELLENIAQQAALALDNAEHHAEVETRSQHDSLTGVLNHNAFLARFERQAREAAAVKDSLSLIMLDIDHFKLINDQYGHLTGDEVLTNLCQIIRRNVKKSDLIGRWGGEEFIISLPHANGPQAYRVAERIRNTLENTTIADRSNHLIALPTISQGIAVFLEETTDFIKLVDLADQRLYIAKERGRDQIEPSLQALEETQPFPVIQTVED
jgi:diguanylate cyclase (GGDEF)-like protein